MFVRLEIENICGITDKIEIDFISRTRYREDNKFLKETHDNIYINKRMAVIGANSTRKK